MGEVVRGLALVLATVGVVPSFRLGCVVRRGGGAVLLSSSVRGSVLSLPLVSVSVVAGSVVSTSVSEGSVVLWSVGEGEGRGTVVVAGKSACLGALWTSSAGDSSRGVPGERRFKGKRERLNIQKAETAGHISQLVEGLKSHPEIFSIFNF